MRLLSCAAWLLGSIHVIAPLSLSHLFCFLVLVAINFVRAN